MMLDGDPTRLEQIVVNLLSNAARYTEPGAPSGWKAAGTGGVVITVRDTAGDRLRQFAKMFMSSRKRNALSPLGGRLGLGLSIVKGWWSSMAERCSRRATGSVWEQVYRAAAGDDGGRPAGPGAGEPRSPQALEPRQARTRPGGGR